MTMIVDNADNGKSFTPDAKLDTEREYDCRIVGLVHVGTVENQNFDDKDKMDEIEQAIVLLELTEEETYVPRGAEGSEVMKPRVMPKFIKYSSHEKSGLFKLAKNANTKSAWVEGKNGKIDLEQILGEALIMKVKDGKEDKQNISELNAYPAKFKSSVGPMVSSKFLFDIDSGAHAGSSIEDVPVWILNYAINKAVNVEEFKQLEAIEAYIKSSEDKKDSGKLEGDDKPKNTKRTEKPVEKSTPEPEDKVKDEPKPDAAAEKAARRARRAKPEAPKVDFDALNEEQLEDHLIELGVDNAGLDAIEAAAPDVEYAEALRAHCKTL